MTSWVFLAIDACLLWAAVILGFAWQLYWAEHDANRDRDCR